MKRSSKAVLIAAGIFASLAVAGAGLSYAHERWGGSRYGDGFHGRGFGDGQVHGPGMRGERMLRMFERFDGNGDGSLTQSEIDEARAARLAEFDQDQDGKLTLAEYEALWVDTMRFRMVDAFQRLDEDGDAAVTLEEFQQPFARIVQRRDRNGDGVLSQDDRRRFHGQGRGPRWSDQDSDR